MMILHKRIAIIMVVLVVLLHCMGISTMAFESDLSVTIPASVYELDKDSYYVIDEVLPSEASPLGILSLEGDMQGSNQENSVLAYKINSGDIVFSYKVHPDVLEREEEEWHITDDKTKKVNGVTLDENILSGALILQTSLDGDTWTEDVLLSDVFDEKSDTNDFYTTKDIQLQNGCYYRVIVAYKMERRLEDSKVLFVTTKNYEYKQVVEVYEFFAYCETNSPSPETDPHKRLGSKINTGKDNGYSGNVPIDKDDPHFGWDIGDFYINGYTIEKTSATQTPVFLKNVGDKVTLWFHLKQDINQLNGNKHLTINEDTNGYDQNFEIDQINFKHGTLIIQHTNAHGESEAPIIYTDYLAANARTGAYTKVQLFEEGDYVVSLNYEIKSMSGPLNQIASYTNYKIMFEFSIRNGNCMVFPFDNSTGAELADNSITENGFKLDMAKSKFLTIDVSRSTLVESAEGYLSEDVRFNRPAKDGEVYTDEGIYTFDVSNAYTGQHTTKTIFVGSNKYLRALSINGISIAELNNEIKNGSIIHENGTIEFVVVLPETTQIDPPVITAEPVIDTSPAITETEQPTTTSTVETRSEDVSPTSEQTTGDIILESEKTVIENPAENDDHISKVSAIPFAIVAFIALIGLAVLLLSKLSKRL